MPPGVSSPVSYRTIPIFLPASLSARSYPKSLPFGSAAGSSGASLSACCFGPFSPESERRGALLRRLMGHVS